MSPISQQDNIYQQNGIHHFLEEELLRQTGVELERKRRNLEQANHIQKQIHYIQQVNHIQVQELINHIQHTISMLNMTRNLNDLKVTNMQMTNLHITMIMERLTHQMQELQQNYHLKLLPTLIPPLLQFNQQQISPHNGNVFNQLLQPHMPPSLTNQSLNTIIKERSLSSLHQEEISIAESLLRLQNHIMHSPQSEQQQHHTIPIQQPEPLTARLIPSRPLTPDYSPAPQLTKKPTMNLRTKKDMRMKISTTRAIPTEKCIRGPPESTTGDQIYT
jgi:hypothetical protein